MSRGNKRRRHVLDRKRATLSERVVTRPANRLHGEKWNRDACHGMAAELEARFDAEDDADEDGWITLTRHRDRMSVVYNPATRRAYWTGFDPKREFFVADIEDYITKKLNA